MDIYSHQQTLDRLPFPALIDNLKTLFAAGVTCPDRHAHTIDLPHEKNGTLLLMPGWHDDIGCVKIVTVTPENRQRNLAAVMANILVFKRSTGEHVAMLNGDAVTTRRTAAASALAADYLAPKSAKNLLIIGAGNIAEQLPAAFASVRDIARIQIWNRSRSGAVRLVEKLAAQGITAEAIDQLENGVREADIVSAATLSTEPLIKGEWLHDNQHIDLIGSFTPTMREADDTVFRRASVFIDSPFAAKESGEILIPIQNGAFEADTILGDLYVLTQGTYQQPTAGQPTVFKGAGNAVMDLAAVITATEALKP